MSETSFTLQKEQFISSFEEIYTQKLRIGILGGSFNPPHLGHMQMAIEAINLGYVDEVWVIPCGDRKDKKFTIPGEVRLNMVKMIVSEFFADNFPIKVNDIEIQNGQQIPTYNLMKQLKEKYSDQNYEFYFIMGSDLLDTLHLWNEGEKLKKEISFVIYRRSHSQIDENRLPKNYILINTTFISSSSSEIRNRIKRHAEHQKVKKKSFEDKYMGVYGILPPSIILFIKHQGLYLE